MCETKVVVDYRRDGTPIEVKCGTTRMGEVQLCDPCHKKAEKKFPQGWRYYPGDTCKHGRYVGGMMEDLLCPYCENGE